MATSFENIDEPGQVAIDIGMRIRERIPNTSLGGQMHDSSNRMASEKRSDRLSIGKIQSLKLELRERLQLLKTSFFQAHVVIGVQVI